MVGRILRSFATGIPTTRSSAAKRLGNARDTPQATEYPCCIANCSSVVKGGICSDSCAKRYQRDCSGLKKKALMLYTEHSAQVDVHRLRQDTHDACKTAEYSE
ncbi:unnamed protein product [Echinostoma caproni]|uniref:Kazal-like domain-containing protein n=1 Tax=Echinostoma caproni TaxID=27848 RepID=A0A183BDZ9_9TREM|nr:unnamed protein product [Echinostoma caproni]